jgi:membrane-associated phospholipid phosphatase
VLLRSCPVCCSLLTALLTTLGKRLTKRVRPCPSTLGRKFFNLRSLESNFSFPSGDSAQGSVLACNLFYYARSHAVAGATEPEWHASYLLGLIPTIMTARVYFGAHWWSDTIMGVLIGWVATVTSWTIVEYVFGWQFGSDDQRTHRAMTHFGFIAHP